MNMDEIQKYIEKRIKETGDNNPSMDTLNKFIGEWMQIVNRRSRNNFEGYSPEEMNFILYDLFEENCPVQLADFPDDVYDSVPLFLQVKALLSLIEKEKEVKLTKTGNLPVRIVKELYATGAVDPYIENGLFKLRTEKDSTSVQMARIAAQLMRAIKTRHNVLSLTKIGTKLLGDNRKLLTELLIVVLGRISPAYFDNFFSYNIGAVGRGFSIILLDKYGEEDRKDLFYADKYFLAFPKLRDEEISIFVTQEETGAYCFSHRTFVILFYHLGLVTIDVKEKFPNRNIIIHRTDLFKKLFRILPPETEQHRKKPIAGRRRK